MDTQRMAIVQIKYMLLMALPGSSGCGGGLGCAAASGARGAHPGAARLRLRAGKRLAVRVTRLLQYMRLGVKPYSTLCSGMQSELIEAHTHLAHALQIIPLCRLLPLHALHKFYCILQSISFMQDCFEF